MILTEAERSEIVNRFTAQKREQEERQKLTLEKTEQEAEQQKKKAYEAGVAWAKTGATFEQLQELKSKTDSLQRSSGLELADAQQRFNLYLSDAIPHPIYCHDSFVKGALDVYEQVEDALKD